MQQRPSSSPVGAAQHPDPKAGLSGLLWTLGGLLVAVACGLLWSGAWAVLALGVWCLVTAVTVGRRR